MEVVFDSLAQLELDDATQYYELRVRGLGKQFRQKTRQVCEGFVNTHFYGP